MELLQKSRNFRKKSSPLGSWSKIRYLLHINGRRSPFVRWSSRIRWSSLRWSSRQLYNTTITNLNQTLGAISAESYLWAQVDINLSHFVFPSRLPDVVWSGFVEFRGGKVDVQGLGVEFLNTLANPNRLY